MRKYITSLTLFLVVFNTVLVAQNQKIAYSYDDAGNRIKRDFIVARMAKDITGKGETEAKK